MPKESTKLRTPSKKLLAALSEALDEIDAYFGISPAPVAVTEASSTEATQAEDDRESEADTELEDYYDDGDYDDSDDYVDKEEVEVAVDAFVSSLLNSGMIRRKKSGKLPSFSEVFEKIFGPDHGASVKARSFEEHTKGYFGWISPEEMDSARDDFLGLQEIVKGASESESII